MNDSDLDGTLCWTPKCLGKKVWQKTHGARKWVATWLKDPHNYVDLGVSVATATLVGRCSFACVGWGTAATISMGTALHKWLDRKGTHSDSYWAMRSSTAAAKGYGCGMLVGAGCGRGLLSPKDGTLFKRLLEGIKNDRTK